MMYLELVPASVMHNSRLSCSRPVQPVGLIINDCSSTRRRRRVTHTSCHDSITTGVVLYTQRTADGCMCLEQLYTVSCPTRSGQVTWSAQLLEGRHLPCNTLSRSISYMITCDFSLFADTCMPRTGCIAPLHYTNAHNTDLRYTGLTAALTRFGTTYCSLWVLDCSVHPQHHAKTQTVRGAPLS
jgi:hypothetical protein